MNADVKATVDRVWDVVGKAGICMLTTHAIDGQRVRPMEALPDREGETIWFLTGVSQHIRRHSGLNC